MGTERKRRVLIVEDDVKIARILIDYLRAGGFDAESVGDGVQALSAVQSRPPDALILDVMLPGVNGISVCKALRQRSDIPIMIVTARAGETDRLLGLDSGADDYVCKPFSGAEVTARMRALVRRAERLPAAAGPPWRVDPRGLRISWRRQALPLTPVEFRILQLLLSQPGRVFTRGQLLDGVHSDLRDVSDRAVDSHVKNIRRKLAAADPECACITSVYGIGYRFDAPAPLDAGGTTAE